MTKSINSNYKFCILALLAATSMFVVAMPTMSMPVLFDEIAEDLGLTLMQIGIVWGVLPLGGIVFVLIGGMLGDRFGAKNVIGVTCLLAGLTGAARGFSEDFFTLMMTMFLFGLTSSIMTAVVPKAIGTWFQGRQLAIASSIGAVSMAIGFTLGTFLSATVFSPLLGGWRNVLFTYGAISIALGLLWFLTHGNPGKFESSDYPLSSLPFRQTISHVSHIKSVWLLTIILLGHSGCVQGMLGYLPLYLRQNGWTAVSADSAAASFHVASLIATIPIALLSNKLTSRKFIFYATMLMTAIGVALLSMFGGSTVWLCVIIAGCFRDGFMAIFMTTLIETEGIGTRYAGTALGLISTFARLGEIISPPIGNSLGNINASLPFLFWSFFAVVALVASYFLKETAKREVNLHPQ
jgi:NNP family nitrate/nitrite transporter-like MFS transporter